MIGSTMSSIYHHIGLAALVLLQVLLTVLAASSESDSSPLPGWKTQLIHFRKWSGTYQYDNRLHSCQLVVHSVQKDVYGGASVSFKMDETAIDMQGYSDDNVMVTFKKEAQDYPHKHFPAADNLEFEVRLVVSGRLHAFIGNITQPVNSSYGTIRFYPDGALTWSSSNSVVSSHTSIGLAVGVSLAMLVICIVIGIIILRWAIRKGYLRHVAMSYKNFRNPTDAPVSFESDRQQPTGAQAEGNVHI